MQIMLHFSVFHVILANFVNKSLTLMPFTSMSKLHQNGMDAIVKELMHCARKSII